MSEVVYGRTREGQLLYDLAFAKLTDKWLARKWQKPIAEIRSLRETARTAIGFKPKRKKK